MSRHDSPSTAGAPRRPSLALRRALRALVPFSLLATVSSPAFAVRYDWINAAGGFAGVAANWNPATRPGALDTLTFDLASTYGVTFGANVSSTNRIRVFDGTVNFDHPVAHTHSGTLLVGSGPSSPILDFTSGTNTIAGAILVGSGGADAILRVTGSGTDVFHTAISGALEVGHSSGIGTLTVRDGGVFSTTAPFEVGNSNALAEGTVKVTGDAVSPVARRSVMTVLPSSLEELRVGYPGTGAVEVRSGGLLDCRRTLVLGGPAGSIGTLLATGTGAYDSSRVTISEDLWVGRDDDGVAGGTGAVTVSPGGVVEVAGSTYLYDDVAGGGDGTLTISDGGRFATGSLYTDDSAAQLQLDGGKLQIVGGVLEPGPTRLTIDSAIGSPELELLDGALAASVSGVSVGATGNGILNVRGGSRLYSNTTSIIVGASAGGVGTLLAEDGLVSTNVDVVVGQSGTGTLNVRDDGQVYAGTLYVGQTASANGTVLIKGVNAKVDVSSALFLSGTGVADIGSLALVTLEGGGALNLNNGGANGTIWTGGNILCKTGGTLSLDGSIYLDGSVEQLGGAVTGGTFTLRGTGRIVGRGDFLSGVTSPSDSTTTVQATGTLAIGRADLAAGFECAGRVIVNGHTMTLRDADSASVGPVWLSGGTLVGPSGGIRVVMNGSLLGSGTVQGRVMNHGAIAANAVTGLSFAGMLESYGRPVSGALRFLPGGGFTGSGVLSGSIVADSGATITCAGVTTLGNVSSPGVLDVSGTLHCGALSVTVTAADTMRVGGRINFGGGKVTPTASLPLRIEQQGRATGFGSWIGTIVFDGRVAPDSAANGVFGTLTVRTLTGRSSGTLEIEVGALGAAQFDRVSATTSAQLAGTLDVRRVGFSANPGDSIQILAGGIVTGTFSNVLLDGGAGASALFEVHYGSNGVWLVFPHGTVDVAEPAAPSAGRALAFAPLGSPGRAPALELALPIAGEATIELFDLRGARLATLADGPLAAGVHRFTPGLDELPAGEIGFARARIVTPSGVERRVVRLLRLR